ncbi:hypothetical protein KXJ74_16425 [Acinetobacter johnsonii]|nr:hypothetical protein KXJ74_16425 [Acinetobacter johnsonii]
MDGLSWYFQYFSIFGVGVHVLIALCFAIHAIRNGQPFFWLWILFVFPFFGSIVYLMAVYLPQSRMPYQAHILSKKALHVLQPNRAINQAKTQYENIPSVENAVRYAEYLIQSGKASEAIDILKQKHTSLVENDPAFLEQWATAYLQDQQAQQALAITDKIKSIDPNYKIEQIALIRALASHQLNLQESARQNFIIATKSQDIEKLSEYALWAIQTNQGELAQQIRADLQKKWTIGTAYSRQLHKPIFKQIDKALKDMKKKRR